MDDIDWAATFAEALQDLCKCAEVDFEVALVDLVDTANEAAADPAMRCMDPSAAAQLHWKQR